MLLLLIRSRRGRNWRAVDDAGEDVSDFPDAAGFDELNALVGVIEFAANVVENFVSVFEIAVPTCAFASSSAMRFRHRFRSRVEDGNGQRCFFQAEPESVRFGKFRFDEFSGQCVDELCFFNIFSS